MSERIAQRKKEKKKYRRKCAHNLRFCVGFSQAFVLFVFIFGNLKTFIASDVAAKHCERVSRCCLTFLTISAVFFCFCFFPSQMLLFYF